VKIFFAALVAIYGRNLIASPIDDLASPLQETRDAAAKMLRTTYIPISRTNWDSVVASIKTGDKKTNVLELLRPFKVTLQGGFGGGGTYSESYRLDDNWLLTCWYLNKDDSLIDKNLSPSLRFAWVGPPASFSGVWITYYVNGQKSNEINYKDGSYSGECISFNPDGSKCVVQHYNHQIAEGADTGYFPSGKIKYQGQYRTNAQVGTWIWYNEDGTTNSIKDYSKP
jgi:hypothetical protein